MSETLSRIPTGMRYYFGTEARLRRSIEASIIAIFEGWSYEELTTPTIDYYSLFSHAMGSSEAHRAFRFSDTDGRLLTVRPDITSAVARAAATIFANRPRPLRFCYVAPVFRQQPRSHAEWRRESIQIGCELIGANTSAADMELLAIICEVLEELDLDRNSSITLNDVEIFNGIADELRLDFAARDELRRLVDTRNTADLNQFLKPYSAVHDAAALADLTQMSGKAEILKAARQSITNPKSLAALDRLERLWGVLDSLGLSRKFEIDLGDVSRLDYYTGLTFRVYVDGAGSPIGSGGRYDGLTASFGQAEPAIGFVLDLDALTDVLLARIEASVAVDSRENASPITERNLSQLFGAAIAKRSQGETIVVDKIEVAS